MPETIRSMNSLRIGWHLSVALTICVLVTLLSETVCNSFKSESIGMIVFNTQNSTTIDHRRPITNVKRVVELN